MPANRESTSLINAVNVMYYFTSPISRAVSMGRRNTQLEPTLH